MERRNQCYRLPNESACIAGGSGSSRRLGVLGFLPVGSETSLRDHYFASMERLRTSYVDTDVAIVREFPIDTLSKGGGVGILDEDPEEFPGRFIEILSGILLYVDGED